MTAKERGDKLQQAISILRDIDFPVNVPEAVLFEVEDAKAAVGALQYLPEFKQ